MTGRAIQMSTPKRRPAMRQDRGERREKLAVAFTTFLFFVSQCAGQTTFEVVSMGLLPQAKESVGPEPRIFLNCQPPFPVTGKPVVARFRANLGPGMAFTARFERDSSGNSR